MAHPTLR